MNQTIYQTRDGDMLDQICYQHYGHLNQAVETVLEHNPGLAGLGTHYPANVLISLPPLAPAPDNNFINIWD